MVARSEEDARNAGGLQSVEERLVVRHDDGPLVPREIEEGVVRGAVTFDGPIVLRELSGSPRVPVVVCQQVQLRQDRRGNRDLDVADDPAELRIQMDLELERHEQGVRVEKDESRHRFRASMPKYMALR